MYPKGVHHPLTCVDAIVPMYLCTYSETAYAYMYRTSNLGIIACLPGADGKYTMVWHFF